MPTETFLKLSDEKKSVILNAAKKEFSRVPFRDASINRIVEEAGISRGSFYQYFEDKKDLLFFLFKGYVAQMDEILKQTLTVKNGDIFEVFIMIYDFSLASILDKEEDVQMFKNVFMSMHSGEIHPHEDLHMQEFVDRDNWQANLREWIARVDASALTLSGDEDWLEFLFLMNVLTKRAISQAVFFPEEQGKVRERLLRAMEMLRRGVEKRR